MTGWTGLRRPAAKTPIGRTGGYLTVRGKNGPRRVPAPAALARRRWFINATKFVLPMASLLLLSTIALWPEFEHATEKARQAMTPRGAAIVKLAADPVSKA